MEIIVILSATKYLEPASEILRFAQDDNEGTAQDANVEVTREDNIEIEWDDKLRE